jgi:malonyl CoA-acyl carrier protein transacylase
MDAETESSVSWWIAGADPDALLAQLDRVTVPESGRVVPTEPSQAERSVSGDGSARLGIVDPDERKLRLARRLVAKGEAWHGRSDIWFSPKGLTRAGGADQNGSNGKVAFLFPGVEPTFEAEGTNLPELAEQVGLVAPDLDDITVAHRSASIFGIGNFLDDVLRRLGIRADVIAGHSIGEWSGTVAAGIVPRARANELVEAADLDGIEFPELDFAALAVGADKAAAALEGIEGVEISHDNSPRQAVICGPPKRIDAALDRLRAVNILGYRLPFRSGFHTRAVAPLVEFFRPGAEKMPFGPADVPLWSATNVAPYPDHRDDIVDLHLRHLIEPVRFRPLIERLYDEVGVRVFVQVGLGSLTGFVDQTLDGRRHVSIPLLTTKCSALAQSHRALTALWVEGVDVATDALLEPLAPETPLPIVAPRHEVANPPRSFEAPRQEVEAPARPRIDRATLLATSDLLSAAAHASRDVVESLAARLQLAPATASVATVPVAAPPSAFVDASTATPAAVIDSRPVTTPSWPTEPFTLNRLMSLETMPETLDHSLYETPDNWDDPSDGFPIVAMTTQIQVLQDIAADHAGGREVVEVSGVRNTRWLDLSDPQEVEITVTPKGDDTLAMMLGRSCRANVRLGSYPDAPQPELAPLDNPRVPDHNAEEMFSQRVMFHGPRFWGITSLGPIGTNGMAAEFHHLTTPGSLLDNLGKIIAYWVMGTRGMGEAALPIEVQKIEFFGPDPAPGTAIWCDIRIVKLEEHGVTADGELVLPDGTVWCRVSRWTSIVFHRDELMEAVHYAPTTRYATEPQPGGWSVALERWPSGPGRELTARRYMTRAERESFSQLNLVQQRRRLIDTVAAKDSVRQWLWDTYQTPAYPVEISLEDDGEQRYRASSRLIPEGHDLRIAVSRVDWLAVAMLTDGRYGDIEARLIPADAEPRQVGNEAADAVASRNVHVPVEFVAPVTTVAPSRIEVVEVPQFAVAWTQQPAAGADPASNAETGQE